MDFKKCTCRSFYTCLNNATILKFEDQRETWSTVRTTWMCGILFIYCAVHHVNPTFEEKKNCF